MARFCLAVGSLLPRSWLALDSLCLALGSLLAGSWLAFGWQLARFWLAFGSLLICVASLLARFCFALWLALPRSVCSLCVLCVFSVCSLCVFSVCSLCVLFVFALPLPLLLPPTLKLQSGCAWRYGVWGIVYDVWCMMYNTPYSIAPRTA
jgi:hypothetical protein